MRVKGISHPGCRSPRLPAMRCCDAGRTRSREFKQRACERASIRVSLTNLLTFPFIRQRVDAGSLKLYGWYYDLENGELMQYDSEKDRFYDMYFGPILTDTA